MISSAPAREKLFHRTEAAQRLQSCNCLRGRGVATDAGRESDFSVLRNSELGRASGGVVARDWFSRGSDSRMGLRTDAGRIEANGVCGRIAEKIIPESRMALRDSHSWRDLGEFVFSRALHKFKRK